MYMGNISSKKTEQRAITKINELIDLGIIGE